MRILAVMHDRSSDLRAREALSTAYPSLEWHCADSEPEIRAMLEGARVDVILAQYGDPDLEGARVLAMARALNPLVPVIVIGAALGEEVAVEALKSGAADYVLTTNMGRLPHAVDRALREAARARGAAELEAQLSERQRLLTAVIDAVPDFLYAVDRDNRIIVLNATARAFTEMSRDSRIGLPIASLRFRGMSAQAFADENARVMAAAEPVLMSERYQRGWDNKDNWVQVSKTPLRGADGASVAGLVTIVHSVTEQRLLERHALEAGEREQRRLGSELHDGLGQDLVAAGLLLSALARAVERAAPELLPRIAEVRDVVAHATTTSRRIAQGLAPMDLEQSGLPGALENLAARSSANFGVMVRFRAGPMDELKLNFSRDAHLYRIAQEAISNAVRHGRATDVEISLELDSGLTLEVRDNGIGFDTATVAQPSGMGLPLMRYRATLIGARIDVRSSAEGTTIACRCTDDRAGSSSFVNTG